MDEIFSEKYVCEIVVLPTEGLVPLRVVSIMTSLCEPVLRKLIRTKDFPEPVKIGEKRIGFDVNEVRAWIEKRKAERDTESEQQN